MKCKNCKNSISRLEAKHQNGLCSFCFERVYDVSELKERIEKTWQMSGSQWDRILNNKMKGVL